MSNSSPLTGQAFASSEWLINHYRFKSPQMVRNITSLPIYNGDRVLDIGCGIGFYMEYFIKMVGPNGKVVGIDHDKDLIILANQYLGRGYFKNWQLINEDILNNLDIVSGFNKIILFNCLSYQGDIKNIIAEIYNNMSINSILIIKDFDMSTSSYNPTDRRMHGEFIEAVKLAQPSGQGGYLNKFVGQSLHRIGREVAGANYASEIWPFIHAYPFSDEVVYFIKEAFVSSLQLARNHCSADVVNYIFNNFIKDDALFYENESSVFIENEHVIILST